MIRPVSLGSLVSKFLSSLGITSGRVSKILNTPDCGCDSRSESLDAWGYRVQYKIIMYCGGPARMTWRSRCRFVRRRLWKTIVSKLTASAGSGGTRH